MKTSSILFPLFVVTLSFTSCEKCDLFEKDDEACPVITAESVPQEVIAAHNSTYSAYAVENWFNKDGFFVAAFEKNGDDYFAKYDSGGNFRLEFREDDAEYESGCECEEEDDD
jgi:hypothetical protein